jgi:hypothetical protein
MNFNSLDREIAAVIKAAFKESNDDSKNEAASRHFREIRGLVSNQEVVNLLEDLFFEIARPALEQRRQIFSKFIRDLLNHRFRRSAATVFISSLKDFRTASFEEILSIVPDAICLDKWIKATKSSAKEVERNLLSQPDKTFETAGADWLLLHSKSELMLPVLEMFLSRLPRPIYLLPSQKVLIDALKKDKSCELLALALRQPPHNQAHIFLMELISSDSALFKLIIDRLPKVLTKKEIGAPLVELVKNIFGAIISTSGSEREFLTASLARLGANIVLTERRSQHSDAVLFFIRQTARQLRTFAKNDKIQSRTWVFENLVFEQELPTGDSCINLQGARYIALAFEKADQGFPAKEILSVTARYLGLSPVSVKGDEVVFNPLQHEDMDGGLVPGERVFILDSGWILNQEVVMRAKVSKKNGGKNV